jgi:hypothetical protein
MYIWYCFHRIPRSRYFWYGLLSVVAMRDLTKLSDRELIEMLVQEVGGLGIPESIEGGAAAADETI